MDVEAVLREACELAGVSPSALAERGGSSSVAMSGILRGSVSPTVRTLDRLLAGVGLQLRVNLEPLLADLDARVDAVLEQVEPLAVEQVERVVQAMGKDQSWVAEQEPGDDLQRLSGPVTWAFDGETSLRAQGLGFPAEPVEVAVAFDGAARAFFFRGMVRGTGGHPVSWFDSDLLEAQQHLGTMAIGPFGMVRVPAPHHTARPDPGRGRPGLRRTGSWAHGRGRGAAGSGGGARAAAHASRGAGRT